MLTYLLTFCFLIIPSYLRAQELPVPGTVGDARFILEMTQYSGVNLSNTQPILITKLNALKLMLDDCQSDSIEYFSAEQNLALYELLTNNSPTHIVKLDTNEVDVLFIDISSDPSLVDFFGSTSISVFLNIGDCFSKDVRHFTGMYGVGCDYCKMSTTGYCKACAVVSFENIDGDFIPLSEIEPGTPLPNWIF